MQTHWNDCWKDPAHHACAVKKIEYLRGLFTVNAKACGCKLRLKDADLPPLSRTEANYWKARYLEAIRELTKANKGIRRLRSKLGREEEAKP